MGARLRSPSLQGFWLPHPSPDLRGLCCLGGLGSPRRSSCCSSAPRTALMPTQERLLCGRRSEGNAIFIWNEEKFMSFVQKRAIAALLLALLVTALPILHRWQQSFFGCPIAGQLIRIQYAWHVRTSLEQFPKHFHDDQTVGQPAPDLEDQLTRPVGSCLWRRPRSW